MDLTGRPRPSASAGPLVWYATRAIPWLLAGTGCAMIVGLMALVAGWPQVMWPLEGTALGLLAGVVAWANDERCAAIVDTLPRSLRWRTLARSVVPALMLAVWIACLLAQRHRLPPHLPLFALQGAAAAAVALAITVGRRAAGSAEPGRTFASIIIPTSAALALIRPAARRLPLFPVWPGEDWARSTVIWTTVFGASLVVLAPALAERGAPPVLARLVRSVWPGR
ncbi:hypothetical protein [Frankia tisae]|uniref:hypothetical protein n=1 Tax=Frankia tisae TaxID=2950104 RepID=UPI0021C17D0A|nr:hypothetical protein [Frankia tisae]